MNDNLNINGFDVSLLQSITAIMIHESFLDAENVQ